MVMNVQEEVEQKTFNIVVSTTKLTARTVLNAGRTALQQYQSKLLADKSSGKQSVRMLLRQNRGVSSVEINKTGILRFPEMSDEWLDFIAKCRAGETHPYDIVEGPMSDDTIWDYVNGFTSGQISREAFWALHPPPLHSRTAAPSRWAAFFALPAF